MVYNLLFHYYVSELHEFGSINLLTDFLMRTIWVGNNNLSFLLTKVVTAEVVPVSFVNESWYNNVLSQLFVISEVFLAKSQDLLRSKDLNFGK